MQQYPDTLNNGNHDYWNMGVWKDAYAWYHFDFTLCMFRWIRQHEAESQESLIPRYVLLVEDDSFLSTQHLLYQIQLLTTVPPEKSLPFYTGGNMWIPHGTFDDSSSLLSGDIAALFAQHFRVMTNSTASTCLVCN